MKRALFTVLALATILAIAGPAFAQAATSIDVAGDWDVTIVSPQGPNTTRLSLKQDADKLTGQFKSQMGELAVAGSVTGSDVKIAFTIDIQGQALDITLNGKATGATIAGTAVFGTFGEGEFTAKRVETTTAAAAPAPPAASADAAPSTPVVAAGKWDVTFKTPQGDMPGTATLTDDGGKLTGTFGSAMGEAPVTGTVAGKSLKLKLQAQTPQGEMQVDMTGDIDGDSIVNGKAEVMGMQLEWTAKRIKQ
jgi:hypothetical protein